MYKSHTKMWSISKEKHLFRGLGRYFVREASEMTIKVKILTGSFPRSFFFHVWSL